MHQYSIVGVDLSLTGAAAKTLVQLATPSTRKARVKEVSITFADTNTAHGGVLVQLIRQTSAGTGTSQAPAAEDSSDPAALSSGAKNFTAEPTSGNILRTWRITPVGGGVVQQLPLGDEIVLNVSERVGLVATAPDNQSNVNAYFKFEE